MNQFLRIQIENIINTLNTFLMSCKIATQRDDGKIDKKEEKTLKKIREATETYIEELKSLTK